MVDYSTHITEGATLSETLSFSISTVLSDTLSIQESLFNLRELPSKVYKKPIATFYLDGIEKGIKSFSIKKDLNGRAEATIITYDDTITESDILKPVELKLTDQLNNATITLFKGVLVSFSENKPDNELRLECRGLDYYLENDLFLTYDAQAQTVNGVFEYKQTRADDIAKDIINSTSFTLIECPTTPISLKFDYENRLSALQLIAEILNKILWIDNNYGVHIGDNSGLFTINEIKAKELTKSGDETYNKIIVIGGNDGTGKVPVGIAEDPNLIAQQGVKAKKVSVTQIRDKDTASLLAKAYLDTYKNINYNLSLKLPAKFKNYLINVGNQITVDAINYIVSSLTLTDSEITLEANPVRVYINLKNYLERQLKQIDTATSSSTFYNESPSILTAYEILDLDTAYYGGTTPKTIVANDSNTYTVLSVMHFYVPENFTINEGEMRIRWFGDESPIAFKIIVNGDVYGPTSEGTTTDGDTLYTVTLNASSIKTGWNDLYIVEG